MLTTAASYRMIASNLDRSLDATAAKPQVSREIDYYLEHIRDVKSVDDFLGDQRLFGFAMKAFGLEDMTFAKAFMRKALTEGVDRSDSFANKLADGRYKEFVEVFNFARLGATTTSFDRVQQGTVDRYVRQSLEETAGSSNEGVRLALYFERKASDITSAYGILADRALLTVAQTLLDLPAASGALDIDRQAKLISDRLDLDDLKNPTKVRKLLERFTSLWEINHPNQTSTPAAALMLGTPVEAGVPPELLASLQNLKLGGN
jgi:hypothetical protein